MVNKLLILANCLFLSGCFHSSEGLQTEVVMPLRHMIKEVRVEPCGKDNVCPYNGAVVMDRQNFQNLQENVINTEAYIKQLEELLNSVTKGVK